MRMGMRMGMKTGMFDCRSKDSKAVSFPRPRNRGGRGEEIGNWVDMFKHCDPHV